MKRTLLLFVLFSQACLGQSELQPPTTHVKNTVKLKRFIVSVNIGASSPYAGFGTKDTANFFMTQKDSNKVRGFANVGVHASADAGYFITAHLGVEGKVVFNYNTIDMEKFNSFLVPHNHSPEVSFDGGYSIWQYMGGPFINFDTKDNTTICLKFMTGMLSINYPDFYITGPSNYFEIILPQVHTIAYSFTSDFEKRLSPLIGIKATIGYTGALVNYASFTYIYTGATSGRYSSPYPVSMSYGSLTFSAGLNFHL